EQRRGDAGERPPDGEALAFEAGRGGRDAQRAAVDGGRVRAGDDGQAEEIVDGHGGHVGVNAGASTYISSARRGGDRRSPARSPRGGRMRGPAAREPGEGPNRCSPLAPAPLECTATA